VHRSTERLADWIGEFAPEKVLISDGAAREAWRERHPDLARRHLMDGPPSALLDLPADRVLNALLGFAGLEVTLGALERGLDLALANKESLVCGGEFLARRRAESRARILPVDSEHAALFQLLEGRDPATLRRVWITASGGPFRELPAEDFVSIGPEEALRHPTWDMGAKITVDSATLVNKGLEVIEAALLFGLPEERIGVLVHPQSRAHALVQLRDGSLLAQMAAPDMRLPILQALAWPETREAEPGHLDFTKSFQLDFQPVDNDRFPAVELARTALRRGGEAPLALSAADEVAVQAFLDGRLGFPGILRVIARVVESASEKAPDSWQELTDADARARERARAAVADEEKEPPA
jgi:1-deoxy-D-xylulose-5-phosphate reductoisomerase